MDFYAQLMLSQQAGMPGHGELDGGHAPGEQARPAYPCAHLILATALMAYDVDKLSSTTHWLSPAAVCGVLQLVHAARAMRPMAS